MVFKPEIFTPTTSTHISFVFSFRPKDLKLPKNFQFPGKGVIYDFFFDKSTFGTWHPWEKGVVIEEIPSSAKVSMCYYLLGSFVACPPAAAAIDCIAGFCALFFMNHRSDYFFFFFFRSRMNLLFRPRRLFVSDISWNYFSVTRNLYCWLVRQEQENQPLLITISSECPQLSEYMNLVVELSFLFQSLWQNV